MEGGQGRWYLKRETIRLRRLDYILSHNDVNGLGCMYKTQTFRIQKEGESYRSTIRKVETFQNKWKRWILYNRARRKKGENVLMINVDGVKIVFLQKGKNRVIPIHYLLAQI